MQENLEAYRCQKIQYWAMMHQPSKNMIYGESFWNQIQFFRDTIIPLFYSTLTKDIELKDYEKGQELISKQYDIIGEHTSKSIILPVLKLTYKGTEIVVRNNFYNYETTIIATKDIELPTELVGESQTFYYEGFPGYYKIHKYYSYENKQKFSVLTYSSYKFYALMFMLKLELDKNY